MPLFRLLFENIAYGGNPVLQGHCADSERRSVEHNPLGRFYHVELQVETQLRREEFKDVGKDFLPFCEGVDCECAAHLPESERGDEPRQPEHVVAVKMGKEDVRQA